MLLTLLLGGNEASKSFCSRSCWWCPLPLVLASVNDLGNGIGILSALGGEGGVTGGAGLGATTGGGGDTLGATTGAAGATTGAGTGARTGAGFGATTGAGAGAAAAGFAGVAGGVLGLTAGCAGAGDGAALGVVGAGCGLFSIACCGAGFLGLKSQAKRLLREQKGKKRREKMQQKK